MRSPNAHQQAPILRRPSATFTLRFGNLAIPVAAYAAVTADRGIARAEYTIDDHPVGRLFYDKETGAVLDRWQVHRMARAADGSNVDLDDNELERLFGANRRNVAVEAFVPLSTLADGTYCIDSTYHLRPRPASRHDPAVAAPERLAVILESLAERGVGALIRPVLAGRLPRCAVITPGGWLLGLAFATEVRPAPAVPARRRSHGPDLEQARRIIDGVGVSVPVLLDHAGDTVRRYVEAKRRPFPAGDFGDPDREVIDLTAMVDGTFGIARKGRFRGSLRRRAPR